MNVEILRAETIADTITNVAFLAVRSYNTHGVESFLGEVDKLAELATEHIRSLITGDLATVTDADGVAHEWNEAILFAIRTVEGA